ncbi:MAG: TonB-dependent receptor [Bacteroidota bacterium]
MLQLYSKRLCLPKLISFVLCIGFFTNLQAQKTVSGTMTGEDVNSPLVGGTVTVQNTTVGALTNESGQYSVSVPEGATTLVFSYIGYETQEVEIGNRTEVNVSLSPATSELDEVVVVGYGTQRKSNVTGSIVSVQADDIAKVQSPSFDVAMQGKVPGVYVTTNGGQPGGGVFVRIRGIGSINNSNPLYVIDGVIVGAGNNENSNPLATINPNDIASIDILKDAASTAIYGARAANGVVLITTKRGEAGKPRIEYSGYVGIQQPTSNLPRPMNAMEFATNMNAAFAAAGNPPPFSNPASLGEGVNYVDEIISNGWLTDHQVSVSGGGPRNNYYISMNYFNNEGIMFTTYANRYSFRANTDNQITDKIKIGNSLMYSRSSQYNNNAGNRTFIHGSFTNLYQALPTQPIYNADGSFAGPENTDLERRRNQVALYTLPDRDNATDRILGNVYLQVEPIKGLVLKSSFSADINNLSDYFWEPSYSEGLIEVGLSTIRRTNNNSFFWLWENTASYSNTFGKNTINLTAGTSAQDFRFRGLTSTGRFNTNVFTEIVTGATELTSTSSFSEESLASVFGRLVYDYDGKYLLTAAVRRDGSSKFGPENKFGVFPSFTAGWRVSKENFWPESLFITDLKLRGGWGQVGSDAIGNFRYLATLSTAFDYAFGNQTGVSLLGAALENLANPGVQWETSTEYNFGFDAGLFDDKLTLSAEYFNRTRTDMLLVLDLPGVSGLGTTVDNVGELVNSGIELGTAFRNFTGDFQYEFNANLTTFTSEVIDLGGKDEIVAYTYSGSGATSVIRPGHPLGIFLGLETLGLFQTQEEVDAANAVDGDPSTPYQQLGTGPGDFRWADRNGDGKVDSDDKYIMGSPVPNFTYGFGGTLRYKILDMNFQFFGVQGNEILNIARSQLESSGRAYNKSSVVVNAWSGPGTSDEIPRPHVSDPNQNIRIGDHLVEDGSFLRLKTLQIGVNLPKSVLNAANMGSARIYVASQNVFVITKFTGIDPEVGLDQNVSAAAGIYQDLYPQVRNISVGINLSF